MFLAMRFVAAGLIQSQTALFYRGPTSHPLFCPRTRILGWGQLPSGRLMLWEESGLWSQITRRRSWPQLLPVA